MGHERRRPLLAGRLATAAITICITVMAAVVAAPPLTSPSGALAAQGEPITWGIQPAGDAGTRTAFEYRLAPGGVVEDVVRVTNFGDSPLTLDIYPADAFNVPATGAFDVTVAAHTPVDVGAWIRLSENVLTIPARSSADVPFTMAVPVNAEPGDHAGGIIAARSSVDAQQLRVDHRVGSRVYVQVDGPRQPALVVDKLEAGYQGTLNPFGRGEISVSYVVRNDGNIRLAATQWIEVEGLAGIGSTRIELEDMPELLPGSTFEGSAVVPDVLPGFRVTTNLHLETRSLAGPEGEVVASTDTWAVPWTSLAFLAVVGLLVAGAATWFVRNRRRQAALLAAAQAASASASGPPA